MSTSQPTSPHLLGIGESTAALQNSPANKEPDKPETSATGAKTIAPHPRQKRNNKVRFAQGRVVAERTATHNDSARSLSAHKFPVQPTSTTGRTDIAQKLAKEHGITVSAPQPAKSALVMHQVSNDSDKAANGDAQLADLSCATHGPKRGGRGRGRGRGTRNSRQPPESRWPRKSDLRADFRHPHSKRDRRTNNRATSGWGCTGWAIDDGWENTGPEIDVYGLVDWSGGWAPAPIDWDTRPAFCDGKEKSKKKIEEWVDAVTEMMRGYDPAIPLSALAISTTSQDSLDADVLGEPAPHYWIPKAIENVNPQAYWGDFVESATPEPVDEDDLKGVKPWWRLYATKVGYCLQPYRPPEIAGIDPEDENEDERIARENDRGINFHSENLKRTATAKKEAEESRRRSHREKLARLSSEQRLEHENNKIRPAMKVVIRSMRFDDLSRVTDIYNYHVHTPFVPETERIAVEDMRDRLSEVHEHKLPFLVACEKGQKIRGTKKNTGEDLQIPDRVVGFAYANAFQGVQGMYKATVEVKIFVDGCHTKKGVGTCLMDKLLGLLDPNFIERGGYHVVRIANDMEPGSKRYRRVSNIVIHFPYDEDNENRMLWTSNWLCKSLEFKQVAHIKSIGKKDDRRIHLMILLRDTEPIHIRRDDVAW